MESASEIHSAHRADCFSVLTPPGSSFLSPGHEEATDSMRTLVSDAFLHTALPAEILLVGDVDQDPANQAGEAGEARPDSAVTAKVDSTTSA
jgi:hypothetical protein